MKRANYLTGEEAERHAIEHLRSHGYQVEKLSGRGPIDCKVNGRPAQIKGARPDTGNGSVSRYAINMYDRTEGLMLILWCNGRLRSAPWRIVSKALASKAWNKGTDASSDGTDWKMIEPQMLTPCQQCKGD